MVPASPSSLSLTYINKSRVGFFFLAFLFLCAAGGAFLFGIFSLFKSMVGSFARFTDQTLHDIFYSTLREKRQPGSRPTTSTRASALSASGALGFS
jgi:hypothetical protein